MDFQKIEEDLKKITYAGTYKKPLQNHLILLAEKLLVRGRLKDRFADFHSRVHEQGQDVGDAIIEALGIKVEVSSGSSLNVPREGPVMVIGNHPFGIIDGMVAAKVIREQRQDLKIVAHQGISGLDEFSEHFLPINFDNSEEAKETNKNSVAIFKAHLATGGVGMLFPAGAVSTRIPLWNRPADPPWHPSVGKWVKDFNCQVLPVFIEGGCGALFQTVSQFSMTLRLGALLRENTKLIDSEVRIRVGECLDWSNTPSSWDVPRLVHFFREKTYALAGLDARGNPF